MRLVATTNEGLVIDEFKHLEKLDLKTFKDKALMFTFLQKAIQKGRELDQVAKRD